MYADRHHRRLDPASLSVALALNAAAVGALLLAAPEMIVRVPHDPIHLIDIPLDPVPPPPLPPPPAHPTERNLVTPHPIVPPTQPTADPQPYLPPTPPIGDIGIGPPVLTDPPVAPPPAPVFVDPSVDPAHADALQPAYPPEERRAEREGRVLLRVLVGTDGRVKQVEPVSATSDAFLAATTRQALAHWRFRPGTRDGVPVERWRTMAVRFVLDS